MYRHRHKLDIRNTQSIQMSMLLLLKNWSYVKRPVFCEDVNLANQDGTAHAYHDRNDRKTYPRKVKPPDVNMLLGQDITLE